MSNENKTHSKHYGIILLKVLYNLIHTARIHKDNNQLIKECLSKFKVILHEMTKEDELTIQLWRGRFHVGGEKLPYMRDAVNFINEMLKYFMDRDIGGLRFFMSSGKALPADILTFIRLVDASIRHENPMDWLEMKLSGQAFSWVQALKRQEDDLRTSGKGHGTMRQERARKVYLHALETVKETVGKASQGIAGVRKARRLAQNIVDLIQEDTSLILGLTTIKNYDDYTYTHSVNVSLLATCLGKYIGISRESLEHLSVCGLFHDLGKVAVSKEVLLKKGELSEDEWKNMQRHPLLGVRHILRLNAEKALRSRIILGPFEHHLNPDMTGYPKTHFMKKVSLMGKILRIADVYEALTSERAYRPRSFTPDEAMRKMWGEGGKSFDPILLKSFIQLMGVYPIGSVVELNDGRVALVKDYPDGSKKDLPLVMVLEDHGNGEIVGGETIDLETQTKKDGSNGLNIARGILPSRIGVPVAQFFLKGD